MQIQVLINNKLYHFHVSPKKTLLHLLRDDLKLTGCKEGCGIGECGACTVLFNKRAVSSCLILAASVHQGEIITIEGLTGVNGELHPLQQAFVEKGAIQCGFCTPGMVLSALALLLENPHPTPFQVKEALAGNLCRCTGYQQIIQAVLLAAERMGEGNGDNEILYKKR